MVHIQKGSEPRALTQAKHEGLKHYSEMDSATKNAVKESLLAEQYHLCAYCMRRIDLASIQIEHYIAQNPQDTQSDSASTIDYHNMLGVCPGGKNQFHSINQLTCDQHRGNTPLIVDPLNSSSVSQIKYKPNGIIYSDNTAINKDLSDTLNLNCPQAKLVDNRKEALDALKKWIQKNYKDKSVPRTEWLRIQNYLCAPKAGVKSEYVGILENYLNKKIRSAR